MSPARPSKRHATLSRSSSLLSVASVDRAGGCGICELGDGIGDQAPDRSTVVIVLGRELIGALRTLALRMLAIPLQHQAGGPPDVEVRDHGAIAMNARAAQYNQSAGAQERVQRGSSKFERRGGSSCEWPLNAPSSMTRRCRYSDEASGSDPRLRGDAAIGRAIRWRPTTKAPPLL